MVLALVIVIVVLAGLLVGVVLLAAPRLMPPSNGVAQSGLAEEVSTRLLAQHTDRLGERIAQLELARQADTASLRQMVGDLRDVTDSSRLATTQLAGSLRDHRVRGLWGETQLRRVIEHAGMERFCDFVEQGGVSGADRTARPDVVVRLPNGRCTVIDAKAPLDHYLQAANEDDPAVRGELIAAHAAAVRGHVTTLRRREYPDLLPGAIDVVVLFLPGDAYLNAALDGDPTLLEAAWSDDIVLATPSSLFAMLRVIAAGWHEKRLADEAAEVAQLGRELHDRIGAFVEHFAKVGATLGRSVEAYNRSVGSLESRLCSTARKLEGHGAGSRREVPAAVTLQVDAVPRALSLPASVDR